MTHRQLDHHEVMNNKLKNSYSNEIIIFLDQLQLPSNIAGIFRLSDAFGMEQILLRGQVEIYNSKKFKAIARTHVSTINYKYLEDSEIEPYLNFLRNQGFSVIGLEFTDHSTLLPNFKFPEKTILVLGNESHGISKKLLLQCESCVHIPMEGQISSLNVSTAASIAMYEIRRTEIIG